MIELSDLTTSERLRLEYLTEAQQLLILPTVHPPATLDAAIVQLRHPEPPRDMDLPLLPDRDYPRFPSALVDQAQRALQPPPSLPPLVGRKAELEQALTALLNDRSVVITGSLGSGKSAFLRQIAYEPRIHKQFRQVWWLDRFDNALTWLALALDTPNLLVVPEQDRPPLLREYLTKRNILLLVDNVERPDLLLSANLPSAVVLQAPFPVSNTLSINLEPLHAEYSTALLNYDNSYTAGDLRPLVEAANGNPRLLHLLASLLYEDRVEIAVLTRYLNNQNNPLSKIYKLSLDALPAEYRSLLAMFVQQPNRWFDQTALIAASDSPLAMQRALSLLERLKFLERRQQHLRSVSLSLIHINDAPSIDVRPLPDLATTLQPPSIAEDSIRHEAVELYIQGIAAIAQGEDGEAKQTLQHALGLCQTHNMRYGVAQAQVALARLAYLQGDDARTVRLLEQAAEILYELRDEDGLEIVRLALSRAYRRAERLDAALSVLGDEAPIADLMATYRARQEWNEAISLLEQAPDSKDASVQRYTLAEIYSEAGRYIEALATLQDDSSAEAVWLRGQVYHLQGDTLAAMRAYEQALDAVLPSPYIRGSLARQMARIFASAGQYADAVQIIHDVAITAEAAIPRPIFARQKLNYALLAQFHLMAGELTQAEVAAQYCLNLLSERPQPQADAWAQRVLARIAAQRGDLAASLRAFEQEHTTWGNLPGGSRRDEHETGVILHNIAEVQAQRSEYDRALANYRRALSNKDIHRDVQGYLLSMFAVRNMLEKIGRLREAFEFGTQIADTMNKYGDQNLYRLGCLFVQQARLQHSMGQSLRRDQILAEWLAILAQRQDEIPHCKDIQQQVSLFLLDASRILRQRPPLADPIAISDLAEQALNQAETYYADTLAAWTARRDLGELYMRLERWVDALTVLEPIRHIPVDMARTTVIEACLAMAEAAYQQGQLDEATTLWAEAAQHEQDANRQALIWNHVADIYVEVGQDEDTLQFFDQAAEQYRTAGNSSGLINTLIQQAYTRLRLRQFGPAIDTFEEALNHVESHARPEPNLLATVLYEMGSAHATLGQYKRAVSIYQRALDFQNKATNPTRYLDTLIGIAHSNREIDAYNAALEAYKQALHMTDIPSQVRRSLLVEQADVLARSAQPHKALQSYQAALDIPDAEPMQLANIHRGLGQLYNEIGNYDAARQHFETLLHTVEMSHETQVSSLADADTGLIWQAVADGYRVQQQTDQALDSYQHALRYLEAANAPLPTAAVHRALGDLYLEQHNPQAFEHLGRALDIERSLPQQNGGHIVGILHQLAVGHEQQGEQDKAIRRYHEALVYQDVRHAPDEYIQTLVTLGRLYTTLGQHREAIKAYEEAINATLKQFPDSRERVDALRLKLGEALYAAIKPEHAVEVYRQVAKSPVASASRDAGRDALRRLEMEIAHHQETLELAEQSLTLMARTSKPDLTEIVFARALQALTNAHLGRNGEVAQYIGMIYQLLRERRRDLQNGDSRPVTQALAAWLQAWEANESGDPHTAESNFQRAEQIMNNDPKRNKALLWVVQQRNLSSASGNGSA